MSATAPIASTVIKRSIVINGHKTSVSLEEPFWSALRKIAAGRQSTIAEAVGEIDNMRTTGNLSSAIRMHVLAHYQARAA